MAQENADPAVASVPSLPGMINEEIEHDLPFINDSP